MKLAVTANTRFFDMNRFSKNLGQNASGVAISGQSERFSPGRNGSKVVYLIAFNSLPGRPTLEPFWPGENLSNQHEIARAVRIWPKLFNDD